MSCGCLRKKATDLDKTRELARKEMEIDKKDYVIYEENGKIYHERKECWKKAGRPGRLREIYYYG